MEKKTHSSPSKFTKVEPMDEITVPSQSFSKNHDKYMYIHSLYFHQILATEWDITPKILANYYLEKILSHVDFFPEL